MKGETSGNTLQVVSMMVDCDNDTILIKAIPAGPVCHTGADTCFGEKNIEVIMFLKYLQDFIEQRRQEMPGRLLYYFPVPEGSEPYGSESRRRSCRNSDRSDQRYRRRLYLRSIRPGLSPDRITYKQRPSSGGSGTRIKEKT